MREVKAVKINSADFAPYGTFYSMTEPEGHPLEGEIHKFYPDRISGTCVGSMAFSPLAVRKDERIIKAAEYQQPLDVTYTDNDQWYTVLGNRLQPLWNDANSKAAVLVPSLKSEIDRLLK